MQTQAPAVRGIVPVNASYTLSDFELITRWRDHMVGKGLADDTIRNYSAGVTKFMVEVVRGPVHSATREHLDTFMMSFRKRATTRSVYARGLRSAFAFWHARGHVEENIAHDLHVPKPKRIPKVVLEEDELIRYMVAAATRDRRRAWTIMLMFSIGCRRAEVAGIAPRDVFADKVRIRFGKGGKRREVELNDLARLAIEGLKPWWTDESIIGGVVPQTVTEWCHDAAKDSGLLEKVRQRPAHVLRASFATHLLRNGTAIHVVRDLMGHENVATTSEYLVTVGKERQEGVDRLPFTRVK
jgi:site-specific recombinase XerD